ncbi:AraC family transcriptional regulator [Desertivirga brevis]|uniref:AraC family transcriptional regulator n=1 Tax=Desertivirga brevis TaxID=2810310 RepID=UPI001A95F27E|nr:helix-turn-helix domain-containing protein [Pedobacter sp. SYSU D00873]
MIFWNLIAGAANLFLLIFCFHLFFSNRGNRLFNRLLMLSFLARVGQDVIFMLINSRMLTDYPYLIKMLAPVSFLAPACFFLYIRSFVNSEIQLRKQDFWHFVIPILILIETIYTLFFSGIDSRIVAREAMEKGLFFTEVKNGLFPVYYYYFGRHALFLGYLLLSWREFANSEIVKRREDKERKWMFAILIPTSLAHITSISLFISHWASEIPIVHSLIPVIITTKYLTLLGFIIYMVHQPSLLYNYLLLRGPGLNYPLSNPFEREGLAVSEPGKEDQELCGEKVIRKSKISEEYGQIYIEAICTYMEKERPFLNSNFQMLDLAKDLAIPSHHCSYVINNVLGKNFRDWVNAYRVQFFIDVYPSKSSSMTVDGIAFESGFASVSTFYRAFKKETGLMPLTFFKGSEQIS